MKKFLATLILIVVSGAFLVGWSSGPWEGIITGMIGGDLIPTTDDTYDLGDGTHEFKDAYIDGTLYVDAISNPEGALTDSTVVTGDIKDGTIVNADISSSADISVNKLAFGSGTTDVASGETNAVEWHPDPYKIALYRLTGTLSDPVRLIISETDTVGAAFSEGDWFIGVNAGTPVIEIGDIDGKQEVLPSGATNYLPQNGMFQAIYSGSAWHVSPLSTDRLTVDTINARVKTFSVSGVAGTYQFADISGVTITLSEAEACGYCLVDSGTSAYLVLPDCDPGSGYVGELGQALISIAGIDVTVTTEESGVTQVWVDGTATVVETGAHIATSTVGEYFTWSPAYVAEYGWRWMIRTKDD